MTAQFLWICQESVNLQQLVAQLTLSIVHAKNSWKNYSCMHSIHRLTIASFGLETIREQNLLHYRHDGYEIDCENRWNGVTCSARRYRAMHGFRSAEQTGILFGCKSGHVRCIQLSVGLSTRHWDTIHFALEQRGNRSDFPVRSHLYQFSALSLVQWPTALNKMYPYSFRTKAISCATGLLSHDIQ